MISLIDQLRNELPPVFPRRAVGQLLGGLISPGTLRNMDSQGRGPAGRFYLGNAAAYRREEFLQWLEPRLKDSPTAMPVRHGKGRTE